SAASKASTRACVSAVSSALSLSGRSSVRMRTAPLFSTRRLLKAEGIVILSGDDAEAGARHHRVELAPERGLAAMRHADERGQIDAGRAPHRLEQVDEILGRRIAGEPAAIDELGRMSANAAEGAVEEAHASLVGGDAIGDRRAARVVEMGDRND